MANQDSISQMRRALQNRMTTLESVNNNSNQPISEDVRFERFMDQRNLDFRKDEKGKNDDEELVYLYISSAVRDKRQFPSPGKYKVKLDSEVDNVVEAALVQASFPLTDPTVNSKNNKVRYSFAPFNNPSTIEIPIGSYKGESLAIEIMRQMNQDLFAAQIPAPYIINDDGQVVEAATGNMPAGIDQFRVTWILSSRKFVFQMVDDTELPQATQFALHIQPLPTSTQQPWRTFNDDLFTLLGYDRLLVQEEGVLDAGSQTYYLVNTVNSPNFGPAADVDKRFENSVFGNQYSDLRGSWVIVVDIDPLNTNDIAFVEEGPDQRFQVGNCFGFVLTKDPAHSNEGMLEINTSGYPVKKIYRNGVSRFNQLTVTLRRPDGTVYDFGGLDHFMAIKLTVKRTQPNKPVFGR